MTQTTSVDDAYGEQFWRDLSREFAFDRQLSDLPDQKGDLPRVSRTDAQMEQQLQAIAETWMICTSELMGLPAQVAPHRGALSGSTSSSTSPHRQRYYKTGAPRL